MIPLYYTGMLFTTVIFHAFEKNDPIVHLLFTILTPLTILNHAKYNDSYTGKIIVYATDCIFAAGIPIYGLITIPKVISYASILFWMCLCINTWIYPVHIRGKKNAIGHMCHIWMHLNMVLGGHAYLITKYTSYDSGIKLHKQIIPFNIE